MSAKSVRRLSIILTCVVTSAVLTACGGGGTASSGTGSSTSGGQAGSVTPVSVDTALSFQTRGQSLFHQNGPAVLTKQLKFDLINQPVGPKTQGKIANTQVPLSVATLQAIWQTAINKCTSYSYTIPVLNMTIHPTQTECINGEIRRDYCIAPPQLGWTYCPDIGSNRQTYVKSVGGGIGPKPTQPTNRPYDLGMLVTSSADLRIGLQGTMTRDLGSVDVDFTSRAHLQADRDRAKPGDVVTLTTGQVPSQPYLMTSRYPSVELALDMYAYFTANVSTEYAGVDQATGDQVHKTTTLYSVDSRNNPNTTGGVMLFSNGQQNLFDMRLDSGGLNVTVGGVPIQAINNQWSYELTWPIGAPDKPGKTAPKFKYPLSFSLADFALSVPQLNTPAPPGFDCGMCTPPLRNFDDGSGTITNTTPLGTRTLIGGITDGNGLTLPLVNDGHEDVDLFRLDVDLDAPTIAVGAPLGAIVSDPLGLITAEVNLLDLDLANFLSVDQRLNFDPNLQVELHFSVPTAVKGPNDADFTTVTTKLVHVGDTVQFRQPASAVQITPVYTLRDNHFVNDTELKVTSAIQESIDQVIFSGTIPDLASSALGVDPNFALLQLTPQLYSPKVVDASDTTPWSLDGFSDIAGTALTVDVQ